jgi:hypothetical protein
LKPVFGIFPDRKIPEFSIPDVPEEKGPRYPWVCSGLKPPRFSSSIADAGAARRSGTVANATATEVKNRKRMETSGDVVIASSETARRDPSSLSARG